MNISPIAYIHTPFTEKFTIPRQSNIVAVARGVINFTSDFQKPEVLDGLEAHSHYWLIWGCHKGKGKQNSLTVRPPRLGGNKHVGVFSTRSPYRPNSMGLSLVKLESIDKENFTITVSGVDILDDTPMYDLKPYLPYADKCSAATSDWANDSPIKQFRVTIQPNVRQFIREYDKYNKTNLYELIEELLSYDVRPAYKTNKLIDDKIYATVLYDVNIAWKITDNEVNVVSAKVI